MLQQVSILVMLTLMLSRAYPAEPTPVSSAPATDAAASGAASPDAPAVTPAATPRSTFGEAVSLQVDGKPFTAVYAEETTGKPKGALLIVPDLNRTPDALGVVSALGRSIPRSGWSCLSLEMPFVAQDSPRNAYGKEIEPAMQRVQAGLAFLKNKQVPTIVVLGHGLGATVAALFLAKNTNDAVIGIAAVGWDIGDDLLPPLNTLAALEKFKTPVLDVYGGRDFGPVRAQAERRRVAVRKGLADGYTRAEIKDANHDFTGLELYLSNRVRGWMERMRVQRATNAPSPASDAKP
jgi:hypothetical protein